MFSVNSDSTFYISSNPMDFRVKGSVVLKTGLNLAFLLCVICVAGCGGGVEPGSATGEEAAPAQTPEETAGEKQSAKDAASSGQ